MFASKIISRVVVALVIPAFAGCAVPVEPAESDDERTGAAEQPIVNGSLTLAGSAIERSTVGVRGPKGCTGTIIAPRFVLTAAHCFPAREATQVEFFSGGVNRSDGPSPTIPAISVDRVIFPDGINMDDGDCGDVNNSCDDLNGRLKDLAILHLAAPVPPGFVPAVLPSQSSDVDTRNGESVIAVGAGNHNGNIAALTQLQFRGTSILDVDPLFFSSDGVLWASSDVTNKGDSGGPLYATTSTGQLKVVGTLRGSWWRVESAAMRSRYTAVRDHAAWIADVIDGTIPETHIVDITHEACGGTIRFTDDDGVLHSIPPGNMTPQTFDVPSPSVTWRCDSTFERTGCPPGTDAVRVFREAGEDRRFTVQCRSHQWF